MISPTSVSANCFAIMVFTLSFGVLLIHSKVYKDFEDFNESEALKYGILDIGSQTKLLASVKNQTDFPKISSFYVSVRERTSWKVMEEVADFCDNHQLYLAEKKVYMRVAYDDLQFLANCLLKPTHTGHANLSGLRVLVNSYDGSAQWNYIVPIANNLQTANAQFGFAVSENYFMYRAKKQLLHYQRAGLTIDFLVVLLDVKALFYDYDTFREYFNEQYKKLSAAKPGLNPQVIIMLDSPVSYFSHLNMYTPLISKFLYRWGEDEKHFVIAHHVISDGGEADPLSGIKAYLFRVQNNLSFKLRLPAFGGELKEIGVALKNSFTDFNSFLIEVDSGYEINHKELMELAKIHSELSRKITWNVIWKLEEKNASLHQNLMHLSNLTRKNPGLIENIYVTIHPTYWENEDRHRSEELYIRERNKHLDVIFNVLNITVTLLNINNIHQIGEAIETDDITSLTNDNTSTALAYYYSPRDSVAPSFLNNIAKYIHKYSMHRSRAMIFYNWHTYDKDEFGDCYDHKRRLTILKNWAYVHDFILVVFTTLSNNTFKYSDQIFTKPWVKNELLFGNGYASLNLSTEELTFLSNFRDKCIKMELTVPTEIVNFNNKYSGITFRLTSRRFLKLGAEELALILRLIHFKFQAVEIVVKYSHSIDTIIRALSLIQSDPQSKHFANYRYYLHFEEDLKVSDLSKIHNYELFSGLHAHLCWCKNDLVNLKRVLPMSNRNVGISLTYDETRKIINHEFWQELVSHIDYCVIRVNVAKELMMGPYSERTTNDFNATFYFNLKHGDFHSPNPVFDNLRAFRFNFRRVNPNVTVFIQIAWPTINDIKSVELAQIYWAFLHEFSVEFNYPFFLYEAFDDDTNDIPTASLKYGWWKSINYTDLGDPRNYIDKQAELYKIETQRPEILRKGISEIPKVEIVIWVVGSFFTILLCAAFFVIRRLRHSLQGLLTKDELQEFEIGKVGSLPGNNHDTDYSSIAYDREKYEIGKAAFNFDSSDLIGSGFFGLVYKATIPKHDKPVAIKVPKINGKHELLSVLREIKLMSYVGEHENILKLVGAYTKEVQKGIVYVITEYADNGCLLDFLRSMSKTNEANHCSMLELYQFCYEISVGMKFLGTKKVIHGDLSARNVLLDENNVCKICDFGLSRKLYYKDLYVKTSVEPIPYKWMAVETLERSELSLKSDIWSMGVTFWEVFSLGEEPYQSISWDLEFSKKLINGLRLPKPKLALMNVYEKFASCWEINPDDRPCVDDLIKFFRDLKNAVYTAL